MKLRFVLFLILILMAAQAAALEPKKASEIVRVEGGVTSNNCVNPPGALVFDTQLLPDGTEQPFEIPKKKVFVMTEVEILGFGGTPGDNNQVRIFTGVDFDVNVVARREQRFDQGGRVFYVISFNPGIVVPRFGSVCVNNSDNVTNTGAMSGYFTRKR